MDETLKQLKEQQINNYISENVISSDINVNKIKDDLRKILGETPAVKINYIKENILNEDGSKSDKYIEKIESITVVYVVDGDDDIPTPVTQTYVIG